VDEVADADLRRFLDADVGPLAEMLPEDLGDVPDPLARLSGFSWMPAWRPLARSFRIRQSSSNMTDAGSTEISVKGRSQKRVMAICRIGNKIDSRSFLKWVR
jgi:hypothetical protein